MSVGLRLLDVGTTFLGVLLCLAGVAIPAAGFLLAVLGGPDRMGHYLLMGAAFITLGVLLFRWHPSSSVRVPLAGEKGVD